VLDLSKTFSNIIQKFYSVKYVKDVSDVVECMQRISNKTLAKNSEKVLFDTSTPQPNIRPID